MGFNKRLLRVPWGIADGTCVSRAGGVFSVASRWLETHAVGFGFFRIHRDDLGSVLPESWHWSYAPVSVPASQAITPGRLSAAKRPGLLDLR